jgi:hypothetical protein
MKKLFFFFALASLIMFSGVDNSFATICTPACKATEYCAPGFTAPETAANMASGAGECLPKWKDGSICEESFWCLSGNCVNKICGKASDSTNPEKKTIDAAEKAISYFPEELKFAEFNDDPNRIIGNAIKAFLGIIGTFSLLVFLYGGIMWMISRGEEAKITKAQKTMVWAALGLFAIFISYAAVSYIINAFKF